MKTIPYLLQVKGCDVELPVEYIPFRCSSGLLPFLSLWYLSSYLPSFWHNQLLSQKRSHYM